MTQYASDSITATLQEIKHLALNPTIRLPILFKLQIMSINNVNHHSTVLLNSNKRYHKLNSAKKLVVKYKRDATSRIKKSEVKFIVSAQLINSVDLKITAISGLFITAGIKFQ